MPEIPANAKPSASAAYRDKLLDPRWQKKRLEVLQRDEWACQLCFDDTNTLHVHHRYYVPDADPWEYPWDALVTLCADCHEYETDKQRSAEHTLLSTLRRSLYVGDLIDFSFAVGRWPSGDFCRTIFAVLEWVLTEPGLLLKLWTEYKDSLKANGHESMLQETIGQIDRWRRQQAQQEGRQP